MLKEVVAAQRHGVIFDIAHGRGGHFNFALTQGARSGLSAGHDLDRPDLCDRDRGPVFDLPTTMTKLMHFGVPSRGRARATVLRPDPGFEGAVGTLRPGAKADVAILELRDGNFEFRDTDGNTVTGKRRLINDLTIKDGRVLYERATG